MRKAPLNSCLISPFSAPNRTLSSSFFPFLYQTRTLLSKPKRTRHFHASNSYIDGHDRGKRAFRSSAQWRAYGDKVRRPNSDPISFVDPYHGRASDAFSHIKLQRQNRPPRPSTVTASEQAVFDRLTKDVSQPTNSETDGDDILDQDEIISGYDPNIDLDGIFEDAIRQLRMQDELAAKTAAKNLLSGTALLRPRAIDTMAPDREQALGARRLKQPLKLADGTTLGDEVETDEERARLGVACYDHRTMVSGMLDSTKSDVEMWQVLEKEVFSLITHLDEHIKLVERAKKLQAAKARRARAEGKKTAEVELEKGDLDKQEISSGKLTETKAIPINNLLAILQENYADYCLHALRLFRRRYPTSLYGPNVLSAIKKRGPISYVLGVSTDIYNEILFLQWTQYSDLHGMADTIEEMLNQGIEGNEVTTALIRGIAKQRRMGKGAVSGPVVKEWWSMRGNVEGWKRMLNLFQRIMREIAERAATLVDETESEDGELESNRE